jgi:hypothetical protein
MLSISMDGDWALGALSIVPESLVLLLCLKNSHRFYTPLRLCFFILVCFFIGYQQKFQKYTSHIDLGRCLQLVEVAAISKEHML